MTPPAPFPSRCSHRLGFSLVEVLVAMGIFTIGLLAIGILGAHGSRWAGISNGQTLAVLMAHDRLEEVRALGYSHWVREASSAEPYEETVELSGIQRQLKIYPDPDPNAPPSVWVEVHCEWTEPGSAIPLKYDLRAWMTALPGR